MTRMLMIAMAAVALGGSAASAQMGTSAPSPLGMTSPLGIGPAPAVPPTGLPLGATELGSLGVSPTTSGASPGLPAPNNPATCRAIDSPAGNLSGTSPGITTGTSTFDGGGIAGTASGTCGAIIPPTTSASPGMTAPVPRIGTPMGSTELGVGGLSPMPTIPTPNPMAPPMTPATVMPAMPCPTVGTTSTSC